MLGLNLPHACNDINYVSCYKNVIKPLSLRSNFKILTICTEKGLYKSSRWFLMWEDPAFDVHFDQMGVDLKT